MKALLQRVSQAEVRIQDKIVGNIQQGMLIFLGIEQMDTFSDADKLLQKILCYRLFSDENNKMNLNVQQVHGGLLIVSQFTLVADTNKGLRPSFSVAATPEQGEALYDHFIERAKKLHAPVATGKFGADMQVHLINNGPVTFLLSI